MTDPFIKRYKEKLDIAEEHYDLDKNNLSHRIGAAVMMFEDGKPKNWDLWEDLVNEIMATNK